jgi:hypothetical protein
MAFMYRYSWPVAGSDRMVAYREFAKGHDWREQKPDWWM